MNNHNRSNGTKSVIFCCNFYFVSVHILFWTNEVTPLKYNHLRSIVTLFDCLFVNTMEKLHTRLYWPVRAPHENVRKTRAHVLVQVSLWHRQKTPTPVRPHDTTIARFKSHPANSFAKHTSATLTQALISFCFDSLSSSDDAIFECTMENENITRFPSNVQCLFIILNDDNASNCTRFVHSPQHTATCSCLSCKRFHKFFEYLG